MLSAHSDHWDLSKPKFARVCASGGPFAPAGSEPLVCHPTLGGAIDPSPFVASDGTLWLV